jgi:Spy/CpxP family protein refolding chaperone
MPFQRMFLPCLGVILVASTAAIAQQTTTTTTTPPTAPSEQGLRPRLKERRMREMRPDRDLFKLERSLNLTDEQRQQQRAILKRHFEATRLQREQLFQMREKRLAGTFTEGDLARAKELRQQMRESLVGIRTESRNLLTAEQRTRLEALREERKQRREEMMLRRQELRRTRPANQ